MFFRSRPSPMGLSPSFTLSLPLGWFRPLLFRSRRSSSCISSPACRVLDSISSVRVARHLVLCARKQLLTAYLVISIPPPVSCVRFSLTPKKPAIFPVRSQQLTYHLISLPSRLSCVPPPLSSCQGNRDLSLRGPGLSQGGERRLGVAGEGGGVAGGEDILGREAGQVRGWRG